MPNLSTKEIKAAVTFKLTGQIDNSHVPINKHALRRRTIKRKYRRYNVRPFEGRMTLFIRIKGVNKIVLAKENLRNVITVSHIDKHTFGHLTQVLTVEEIKKTYHYVGLAQEVKKWWRSCKWCYAKYLAALKRRSTSADMAVLDRARWDRYLIECRHDLIPHDPYTYSETDSDASLPDMSGFSIDSAAGHDKDGYLTDEEGLLSDVEDNLSVRCQVVRVESLESDGSDDEETAAEETAVFEQTVTEEATVDEGTLWESGSEDVTVDEGTLWESGSEDVTVDEGTLWESGSEDAIYASAEEDPIVDREDAAFDVGISKKGNKRTNGRRRSTRKMRSSSISTTPAVTRSKTIEAFLAGESEESARVNGEPTKKVEKQSEKVVKKVENKAAKKVVKKVENKAAKKIEKKMEKYEKKDSEKKMLPPLETPFRPRSCLQPRMLGRPQRASASLINGTTPPSTVQARPPPIRIRVVKTRSDTPRVGSGRAGPIATAPVPPVDIFEHFWTGDDITVVADNGDTVCLYAIDENTKMPFATTQVDDSPDAYADLVIRHTVRYSVGSEGTNRIVYLPHKFTDGEIKRVERIAGASHTVGVFPVFMRSPLDHFMNSVCKDFRASVHSSVWANSPVGVDTPSDWPEYIPLITQVMLSDLPSRQCDRPLAKTYFIPAAFLVDLIGQREGEVGNVLLDDEDLDDTLVADDEVAPTLTPQA